MRKRYVKALVLNAANTEGRLHRGDVVTLDLHSADYDSELIQVVGSGYRYITRFAIDPLLNARGN